MKTTAPNGNGAGALSELRHTDELYLRRKKQRKALPVWYIGSIILHVLLFGALVLFTVVPELKEFKPWQARETVMTPRQLQELTDKIDQIQQLDVRMDVETLEYVRKQMEEIRNQLAENYMEYAGHVSGSAAQEIAKLMAAAKTLQEQVLGKMDTALNHLDTGDKLDDLIKEAEPFKKSGHQAAVQQEQATKQQVDAMDLLDKALSVAQMAAMHETVAAIEEIKQIQDKALAEQQDALATNRQTRDALERLPRLETQRETDQKNTDRHEQRLADLQKQKDANDTRAEQVKEELGRNLANQAEANETLEQARQKQAETVAKEKPTDQEKRQAANAVKTAQDTLKRADAAVANTQKREKDLEAADKRNQTETQKAQAALDAARETLETRKEAIAGETQKAAQKRTTMTPAQQQAKKTQEEAANLYDKVMELAKTEQPNHEQVAELFTNDKPLQYNELLRMDIVDLYDTAVTIEEKVLETYRDVRATERAVLSKMSIESARKLTDVAKTMRPEIDAGLLRQDVRTGDQLEKHKEAVAEVVRETMGMSQAALALLDTVQKVAHANESFTVERAVELAQIEEEKNEAAAEDEKNTAKDLTALMQAAPLPHGGNTGALQHDPRPGTGLMSGAVPPPLDAKMPGQVSGRTISETGVKGSWMALNTWYIIGPFPNPARANIDRKFPPETVIDLDARYVGKDGRPIEWVFHQSPRTEVMPPNHEPYGIWYGYTELRVDRDCDLWIAVGSDDKSKIWINDMPVWISGDQLKSWKIDEGYRKVHFKAGRNRILLRCENGWHTMGWSMLVNLNPR